MGSIKDGDYRVVGAVRSASDMNAWYPVAHDLKTPNHPSGAPKLSCHCPAWTRNVSGGAERTCKHTAPFAALLASQRPAGLTTTPPTVTGAEAIGEVLGYNPALTHIQGAWQLQEFLAPVVGTKAGRPVEEAYHWWLLNVQTADLVRATGIVAMPAGEVPADPRILKQTIAAWAGYQIAAEFLIRAGQRPGEPPAHFRDEGRKAKRVQAIAPHLQREQAVAPPRPDGVPKYGIGDLMVAMHDADQGDGRKPAERAEELLRMMLGTAYANVDPRADPYRGYLDAPSKDPNGDLAFLWQLDAAPRTGYRRLAGYGVPRQCREIVYRVRVDKGRQHDRRIRVWIDGRYLIDLCVVRDGYTNSKVPIADAFLSRYLGMLTNPRAIMGVMGGYNIFATHSDTYYGDDRYGEEPPQPIRAR